MVSASILPEFLSVEKTVRHWQIHRCHWNIEPSRTLARLPLIAEAWDAGGLYHVGAFPGFSWTEWNGHYRDVIRRFVRGDRGIIGEVASCIAGSSDLYADDGRLPANSINLITCHDGFTLRDLVSYNHKHNEANGEDNRDGTNDNLSRNCGVEGETTDPAVLSLCRRQAKNFIAILMISRGVPMVMAGAGVAVDAQLPPIPGRKWYPVVDTSDRATTGILPREKQPAVFSMMWRLEPHSVVIFEGSPSG